MPLHRETRRTGPCGVGKRELEGGFWGRVFLVFAFVFGFFGFLGGFFREEGEGRENGGRVAGNLYG